MSGIIKLVVRDKAGVWIDARKSSGGVPFDELPPLEDFPRELKYEEEVLITVTDFSSIIYVRDCKTIQGKGPTIIPNFYCIACCEDTEIQNAYIYPLI